tara:strand:- start:220 stop:672 length:453 start_codon:yes stop_codon:yes gene_type:complete
MVQLCDLDGMIENMVSQLHGIQNWRNCLAAKITDPPRQFGYPMHKFQLQFVPVTDHQRVMRIVPAVTSVKWSRIIGKQRSRKVVNARWHAITMLSDCPSNYTCSQIGRFLKKDHSSILNARKVYIKRYVSDLEFQQTAELCWHKFWEERL